MIVHASAQTAAMTSYRAFFEAVSRERSDRSGRDDRLGRVVPGPGGHSQPESDRRRSSDRKVQWVYRR